MSKKLIHLLIWIFLFQAIGLSIGLITQNNSSDWYQILNKSSLTPPSFVFALVWTILYCLLAVVGWSLWYHRHERGGQFTMILYGLQMVMNWTWSFIFFNLHYIGLSLLWITCILFLTVILIFLTRKNFKLSCILLIPYFFWLLFATYLNAIIWVMN